jgi:hypothetical protein
VLVCSEDLPPVRGPLSVSFLNVGTRSSGSEGMCLNLIRIEVGGK